MKKSFFEHTTNIITGDIDSKINFFFVIHSILKQTNKKEKEKELNQYQRDLFFFNRRKRKRKEKKRFVFECSSTKDLL